MTLTLPKSKVEQMDDSLDAGSRVTVNGRWLAQIIKLEWPSKLVTLVIIGELEEGENA